jgi:SAM-dependent methyltransferase
VSGAYDAYMGRWSRRAATEFLDWLHVPSNCIWLDVGCGTGALTEAVLAQCAPKEILGVDPSEGFVANAARSIEDSRATFRVGNAMSLPVDAGAYDAVVSGLVLNFVPDAKEGVAEMARAVRSGGSVAAYVWDYAGRMELMRWFWDVAIQLNPEASNRDEGKRQPMLCAPGPLTELFRDAGLANVQVRSIDVVTRFADFDDYWTPFTGGQGSAPGYAMSLSDEARTTLRERLRADLPISEEGSITMIARAWAIMGQRE